MKKKLENHETKYGVVAELANVSSEPLIVQFRRGTATETQKGLCPLLSWKETLRKVVATKISRPVLKRIITTSSFLYGLRCQALLDTKAPPNLIPLRLSEKWG